MKVRRYNFANIFLKQHSFSEGLYHRHTFVSHTWPTPRPTHSQIPKGARLALAVRRSEHCEQLMSQIFKRGSLEKVKEFSIVCAAAAESHG